jgi:NOL1/NOP2/sun family putative RNA methylase
MVERYTALFGEETEAFLEGNDQPLPKTIRSNTLALEPQELVNRLERKGFKLEPAQGLDYAFRVTAGKLPLGATTEYLLGYYFVQSVASMWAVEVLNPGKSEVVVDMCAAPGGKTTHIAEMMRNKGALLATDISRSRMRGLRSNLSRMRVENVLAIRVDAAQLPETGVKADKVLLDAPCTGEGLIPLDPKRKQSRSLEDIQTMASVQRKLIVAASKLLEDGGTLVYSTCSVAPEENEEIIDYALQHCPLRVVDTGLPFGERGLTTPFGRILDDSLVNARRFFPYKHEMEGFFICKLEKIAG